MGEVILLLSLAGLSVAYFIETLSYQMPAMDKSGGPAIFPQIICAGLIILIVIRIIQFFLQKERKDFALKSLFTGSTGLFFIGFVVYVALLPFLGYIVDNFLFLSIVSNALLFKKDGKLGSPGAIAIREGAFLALTLGLYFFFTAFLVVALPKGILSFLPI